MSQADLDITKTDANTGSSMRSAINDALQALGSCQGGAGEPGTMYPYMLWADTNAGKLKMRNTNNNDWWIIGDLNTIYLGLCKLAQANTFTAMNEFQKNIKFKGPEILLRLFDTGSDEWAIRSKAGKLELCRNTNNETTPIWSPELRIDNSGLVQPDLSTWANAAHQHIDGASGGSVDTMTMIVDHEVASHCNDFTINGLNSSSDEFWTIAIDMRVAVPWAQFRMRINGDAGLNYYTQGLRNWNTTAGHPSSIAAASARGELDLRYPGDDANCRGSCSIDLSVNPARPIQGIAITAGSSTASTGNEISIMGYEWLGSGAISSLKFYSGNINAIGAGTRVRIWSRR